MAHVTSSGYPDIFSARAHRAAKWAVPVVLGLVYGFWAAANRRDGDSITGWNILFGFVAALAFIAVYIGVRAVAPRLPRELHAVAWGAFAGVAFGFLYSQTGASVLRIGRQRDAGRRSRLRRAVLPLLHARGRGRSPGEMSTRLG